MLAAINRLLVESGKPSPNRKPQWRRDSRDEQTTRVISSLSPLPIHPSGGNDLNEPDPATRLSQTGTDRITSWTLAPRTGGSLEPSRRG